MEKTPRSTRPPLWRRLEKTALEYKASLVEKTPLEYKAILVVKAPMGTRPPSMEILHVEFKTSIS